MRLFCLFGPFPAGMRETGAVCGWLGVFYSFTHPSATVGSNRRRQTDDIQPTNRWEEMLGLIVQHGGDAARVPQHVLAKRVKAALDRQWQRLRFGKHVDKVGG